MNLRYSKQIRAGSPFHLFFRHALNAFGPFLLPGSCRQIVEDPVIFPITQTYCPILFLIGYLVTVTGNPTSAPNRTAQTAMRLLKAECFACHNTEKKKGGLVL